MLLGRHPRSQAASEEPPPLWCRQGHRLRGAFLALVITKGGATVGVSGGEWARWSKISRRLGASEGSETGKLSMKSSPGGVDCDDIGEDGEFGTGEPPAKSAGEEEEVGRRKRSVVPVQRRRA